MVVRELITRLGFNLDQNGINRAEAATNRLRDRANETANAFRNIFAGLVGIQAVRNLVHTADTMQSIRARIEQLPQTVMAAGDAFDMVADRASAARAPIEAYAGLYNRLGNAAKDYITTQEDLLGITDTISKALVVGGATAQEAGSVMLQFSQALGSGTLQGDEFRAMAEAAPQYLDKLSEAMNIPRAQLKKMASEGKLTSKEVIEATRKMADYFDDKFSKMPMTVSQAVIVVGNRFSKMIDRMNRESGFVSYVADKILNGFKIIETGVDNMIKKFDGWENAVRFVGIAIATAFGAKALAMLVAYNAMLGPLILRFALIAAAILLVAALAEDLYLWVNGKKGSLAEDLIGPWDDWSAYAMGAIDMVKDAVVGLAKLIGATAAIIKGVFTFDPALIKEGFAGAKEIILNGLNPAINAYTPSTMGGESNKSVNVKNETNVNVTVPAGTSAEQAAFLEKSARVSFGKVKNLDPIDMGAYAQ